MNITKEILVYNDEAITVYGPGITFNYTIAPAEPSSTTTVTDKTGKSAIAKKGISGGVTLTDSAATFTKNTAVDLSSANPKSIADTITASVNLSEFSAPGIYRYVITETKPTDFETVGLTRPENYVATRYLDVYIKNGNDGLEVSGYVVFIADDASKKIDGNIADNNEITGKTTGFVDSYDSEIDGEAGTDETGIGDKYYTYNYTLTKVIEGGLADKTHAFPFAIETAGAVSDQNFTVTSDSTTLSGVTSGKGAIGTDIGTKLSNGQKLTIKGLPANATINVTETNDNDDAYDVKASDATAGELVASTSVAKSGTASTTAKPVSKYASNKVTKPDASLTATTFTNTLNEVSPTNVVMRFAPYLFILGAAIVLLVLMRRRKAHDAE